MTQYRTELDVTIQN